jgi:hypothetical protein
MFVIQVISDGDVCGVPTIVSSFVTADQQDGRSTRISCHQSSNSSVYSTSHMAQIYLAWNILSRECFAGHCEERSDEAIHVHGLLRASQ